MGLEYLIVRLRIEEDNRGSKKKTCGNYMVAKAHEVEDGPKNKKKKHQGKALAKETQRKMSSIANTLTATRMVIEQWTVEVRENPHKFT